MQGQCKPHMGYLPSGLGAYTFIIQKSLCTIILPSSGCLRCLPCRTPPAGSTPTALSFTSCRAGPDCTTCPALPSTLPPLLCPLCLPSHALYTLLPLLCLPSHALYTQQPLLCLPSYALYTLQPLLCLPSPCLTLCLPSPCLTLLLPSPCLTCLLQGLRRPLLPGTHGRYAPVTIYNSFNSHYSFENDFVFNVIYHSDHHVVGSKVTRRSGSHAPPRPPALHFHLKVSSCLNC